MCTRTADVLFSFASKRPVAVDNELRSHENPGPEVLDAGQLLRKVYWIADATFLKRISVDVHQLDQGLRIAFPGLRSDGLGPPSDDVSRQWLTLHLIPTP